MCESVHNWERVRARFGRESSTETRTETERYTGGYPGTRRYNVPGQSELKGNSPLAGLAGSSVKGPGGEHA
eukprot:3812872-Rhodomonas_salina.1